VATKFLSGEAHVKTEHAKRVYFEQLKRVVPLVGSEQENRISRPIPPALFALKGWTIKMQNDKFYIAPTAHFDDTARWSNGYASLQSATLAIARKLAEEWRKRDGRRRAFHRLQQGAV
jgi:hypothetical protein